MEKLKVFVVIVFLVLMGIIFLYYFPKGPEEVLKGKPECKVIFELYYYSDSPNRVDLENLRLLYNRSLASMGRKDQVEFKDFNLQFTEKSEIDEVIVKALEDENFTSYAKGFCERYNTSYEERNGFLLVKYFIKNATLRSALIFCDINDYYPYNLVGHLEDRINERLKECD